MCATGRGKTLGSTGSGRARIFLVAALLLLGALVQACSDQKGSKGTSFPTGTTGNAETSANIRVQVGINPNTIELGRSAGITVLATNTNGLPLEGRLVQLTTSLGQLSVVDGFTDAAGKFVSALRVTATDVANAGSLTSATVTAFVEGASGSAIVNFALPPTPGTLIVSPSTLSLTNPSVLGVCAAFQRQFTISGGVPPYSATTFAPGTSITRSGLYTFPAILTGQMVSDTITVVDSANTTVNVNVSITCS
jgi:hypothetical protein